VSHGQAVLTQGQAVLLVIAFVGALALTVTVGLFVTALVYEFKDRRRKRTRQGMVDPLESRPRVGVSGRWSN